MNRDRVEFTIRSIAPTDAKEWERMRCELWPDGVRDHAAEIASFFAGELVEPQAVLVAAMPDARLAGFIELSTRTDLAHLENERVGYVEGLYIIPETRGGGLARLLLQTGRDWARRSGCTLFASDRAERLILDPAYKKGQIR